MQLSLQRLQSNEQRVRARKQALNSLRIQGNTMQRALSLKMQAHLEYIVGKIAVCVKSKNWLVLTTWDGALQWYVPTVSSERYDSHATNT